MLSADIKEYIFGAVLPVPGEVYTSSLGSTHKVTRVLRSWVYYQYRDDVCSSKVYLESWVQCVVEGKIRLEC